MNKKKPTPLLTWLRNHTKAEREQMAERAETSVMYLYQIGTGFRGASTEKAELIENATNNELTKMQVLYPYD